MQRLNDHLLMALDECSRTTHYTYRPKAMAKLAEFGLVEPYKLALRDGWRITEAGKERLDAERFGKSA